MTSLTISETELTLFQKFIEQECGITISSDKAYLLETRLSRLALENACVNFTDLYKISQNDPTIKNKIIEAMTTNETLWFRDQWPYEILKEVIFPELLQKVKSGEKRQIRFWSAACSSGQEPYSISLVAHELARLGKGKELTTGALSITATDLSKAILFIAKAGRYDGLSISRGMPEDLKERYFKQDGRVYVLDEAVRQIVQFQQLNLMNPFTELGRFDVVMLRNVAIYFSAEFKKELFKKIAQCLNPGGYLFIGASESLIGYSDDFDRLEACGGAYFKLKGSR